MCPMPVLTHVGVIPLAKISALFGLIMGLVYGILLSFFAIASVSVMPGVSAPAATGAGVGVALILFTVIAGGIGGFIYGAVMAFLYNVFAGWIGGVELEIA